MSATPHHHIGQWIAHLQKEGKSQYTIKAYRLSLGHLANWSRLTYGEAFDPTKAIPRDIRDWKSHQQTVDKAAPSTINQRLAAASSFYKWAVDQELLQRDPTAGVQSIRLPRRKPKSLSYKELRRLIRKASNSGQLRDVAIIEVLAGTGLRVGELLQLQCGDVVIRERSGWVTVREGKHGGYREIPLTRDVRRALEDYLEGHPYNKEGHRYHQDPDAPLWLGKHGQITHRSSILRILNKYTMRAGLEPIGPHVLRHTFSTLYLKANPDDLRGLAALLGHSDLNTVMIYTEPTLDDLAERMERTETLS
jgi:site-specific recombinase XerD